MNEYSSQSTDGPSTKGFFERLIQLFQNEPKDRDDLVDAIRDSGEQHLIDNNTQEMLEGVLQIADMRVRDIMISRSQMVTIDRDNSLDEILSTICEYTHSRYPVISDDKDHVDGILHAKDILTYFHRSYQESKTQNNNKNSIKNSSDIVLNLNSELELDKIIRPAVIVPESKRLDRLLKEFREQRYHMAIVVDEFGGVSGLLTIEDILEQIVGEIEDEFDDEEIPEIKQLNKHNFSVNALIDIQDFNDYFHTHFSDEEFDTIGGFVMSVCNHLPIKGEEIKYHGFIFKVTSSDNRRIIQFQVTIPSELDIEQVDN